jgi:hypothetical protein
LATVREAEEVGRGQPEHPPSTLG